MMLGEDGSGFFAVDGRIPAAPSTVVVSTSLENSGFCMLVDIPEA